MSDDFRNQESVNASNDPQLWKVEPGFAMGVLQLGTPRHELLQILRDRNFETEEFDFQDCELYVMEMDTTLYFGAENPHSLELIEVNDERVRFGNLKVLGDYAHNLFASIPSTGTLWFEDFSRLTDAFTTSSPERMVTDDQLLARGTLWITDLGLGFGITQGKITTLYLCDPSRLPQTGYGEFTGPQRQLSERLQIASFGKPKSKAHPLETVVKVALFLTAITVTSYFGKQAWDEQNRWDNAPEVEANVVAVWPPPPEPFPSKFHLSFQDSSGTMHELDLEQSALYGIPQVGEKVAVRYLPHSPQTVKGPAEINRIGFELFVPYLLGILAIYFVLHFFSDSIVGRLLIRTNVTLFFLSTLAVLTFTLTMAGPLATADDSAAPVSDRTQPIVLSDAHVAAVNRPRRIYVNNDVGLPIEFGIDVNDWITFQFDLFDEPGMQVDTIAWCFDEGNLAAYPSNVIPVLQYPGLQKWLSQGVDIVRVAVDETHKRKKEAFFVYRLNGVDWEDGKSWYLSPLKKQHPEWLTGYTWNFAIPEVRAHKLAVLRELAENYDFDGIDLDFSRRPPHLPVGRQWEHREALTDFMRQVRRMFQEVAQKRGRPLLLAARLQESVAGSHYDGIDVETWARENLLDIIAVGGRSLELDIAGYRKAIGNRNMKLMPSLDDFHTTDGYYHEGIEFWRGLYGNWWRQGIDGAQTFNFFTASERGRQLLPQHPEAVTPAGQRQAFREIGDLKTLQFKDAVYVLQRRFGREFGTDWGDFWYKNALAPLPVNLPADGVPTLQSICIEDDVSANAARIDTVNLRILLSGATAADVIEAKFNGVLLEAPSVGADGWRAFTLKPAQFAVGTNLVGIRCAKRSGDNAKPIVVEKVEIPVDYAE